MGERIKIGRDSIQGYQDQGSYEASMEAVRLFEEISVRGGWHSVIKDGSRYAEELGLHLKLEYPEPMCVTDDGKEVNGKEVKG